MTPDYRTICAELVELSAPVDSISQLTERLQKLNELADRARAVLAKWGRPTPQPVAIPGEKYHEDMGPVTWWKLPVDEPPWVGTPNDSDWPGYHTHFTPAPTAPLNAHALPTPEATNDLHS